MRILVCTPALDMAGSRLQAVGLADAVRRRGHEPVLYAPTGVLAELVEAAGLPWVPAPSDISSRAWSRGLAGVARGWDVDLVHTYEWAPSLRAAFSAGRRLPLLMTVLAAGAPRFLPAHVPLVVGTPALAERAAVRGGAVHLLEPAVHTGDAGGAGDRAERLRADARARWGIDADELVVGTVTMLTTDHERLQGVLEAIRVVDRLSGTERVSLLVAGDGEGRQAVETRAAAVNERHGRVVVRTVGLRLDPDPVYAASDVVLGMGSSAIRAMAHARPLVVQGEAGFWRVADWTSVRELRHEGWFGRGGAGARDLRDALVRLAADPALRGRLGELGRNVVSEHHDLDRAADRLADIYLDTVGGRTTRTEAVRSLATSAAAGARFYADRRLGSVVTRERWAREGALP
ncbi:glycosyltransferase family 4 protein [Georgenia sp. Z1344]|uniref:glycosyltransferase family 4 protein n=1 Tax=Georgenia sp. Z1344 TaxID=3416706 RepID=UPI003CF3175A